jgi:Leucine-rich repeat (LRR) protein
MNKFFTFLMVFTLNFCYAQDNILRVSGKQYCIIRDILTYCDKNIQEIYIEGCNDFEWDEDIFTRFTKINSLQITNSGIMELPEWLKKLNVKYLNFTSNDIQEIDLFYLNTDNIDLSNNPKIRLYSSSDNIKIKSLICKNCNLIDNDFLAIYRCVNIEYLILDNNKISTLKSIPESGLNKLKHFRLSYNMVETIDDYDLAKLPSISFLLIEGNYLKEINIGHISHDYIDELIIKGNNDIEVYLGDKISCIGSLFLPNSMKSFEIDGEKFAVKKLKLGSTIGLNVTELNKFATDSLQEISVMYYYQPINLNPASNLRKIEIAQENKINFMDINQLQIFSLTLKGLSINRKKITVKIKLNDNVDCNKAIDLLDDFGISRKRMFINDSKYSYYLRHCN